MLPSGRRAFLHSVLLGAVAACRRSSTGAQAASPTAPDRLVTLAEDGTAKAAIHVEARVMAPPDNPKIKTHRDYEVEAHRIILQGSVKDLALYLHKISGAPFEILTGPAGPTDTRVPIRVGLPATESFGLPRVKAKFGQGFRVVVSTAGVGLLGESDLATSYAIYELLDRLGCRWYIPSEMGEIIPTMRTLVLHELDFSSAPSTFYRRLAFADDAFMRRNRMDGMYLNAGQSMEKFVTDADRKQHPEWVAQIGGKPDPMRLKWSSASLAEFIGDTINTSYERNPQPSYSVTPEDGIDFDDSPDDKALDAGDFDTTFQQVSLTDRFLVFCNRIAARVASKHPEILLGMQAYAQFTRAPVREKVHPSLVPQIAPITYSRFHPMSDDAVPDSIALRSLVRAWGKAARYGSYYAYAYNLSEPSAPQPMIAKWSFDMPFLLANNLKFWVPETMANFETHMHALYIGSRLTFDAKLRPADIVEEINARFYGNAARAMTAYWSFLDDVWVKTPEYSGSFWGYMRRWTPERLRTARQLMDSARAAARTSMEARRVRLADDSLRLFEAFMKMRIDLAEGRWDRLGVEAAAWRHEIVALGETYKDQYCFTRAYWTQDTAAGYYFAIFCERTYGEAARIARTYERITPGPLRRFRWQADPDKKGEAQGWAGTGLDDRAWKMTDVCTETWSTLGYHDYFKSIWYRTELRLPAATTDARTYLWFAATDGSAKVFVNGKHIPWAAEDGSKDEFVGYAQPAAFDVTDAVAGGGLITLAVLCTRSTFSELGTGGLLGPLVFYRTPPRS